MDGSAAAVAASADDGPDSWELADVDASMRRLILTSGEDSSVDYSKQEHAAEGSGTGSCAGSDSGMGVKPVSEELINTVDQFLRDAIQNPRERVSVLRMEQDVEKFIHDPTREQMEFQQLPTSYLRLAAHRVAQHYSLQSMVLLDNSLPDGSGSRIIIRKTSDICLPLVRLADIPVNLPTEASGAVKVAIKQRPQIGTHHNSNSYSSAKSSSTRSVEERKDEYNKARARIFNSNSSSGTSSGKQETNLRTQDGSQHGSLGKSRVEVKNFPAGGADSSMSNNRLPRGRTEKEPAGRSKTNNRVAIFRDREIDRKDPDYNRSYDRYMQRFDPGFGFTGGPYPIQPMYAPALNYNTEFPQLGSTHRLPIPSDHQPHPIPHQVPAPWIPGYGYGPAETMLSPFSSGHVNAHANSGVYLHSAQYPSRRSVLPYIHPLESIHQPFPQSHQQQSDASYGLARPR